MEGPTPSPLELYPSLARLPDSHDFSILILLHDILSKINPTDPEEGGGGGMSGEIVNELLTVIDQPMLEAALDLLDGNEVFELVLPSGRKTYQVRGSSSLYTVSFGPPSYPSYCPCPSFSNSVLTSSDSIICKHLLACLLAERLDRFESKHVGWDYFVASIAS